MLLELLERAAAAGEGCVVSGERRIGFAELCGQVEARAAGLAAVGVGSGDHVALLNGDALELSTNLLAVTRLGAAAVPLNPLYERGELTFYMAAAGVSALIADPPVVGRCREVLAARGGACTVLATGPADGADHLVTSLPAGRAPQNRPGPDVVAVLLHSSGSTGRPKLIPRTHGQLRAEAEAFHRAAGTSSSDAILCAVPLFHAHGLGNCLLAALRAGATLVLPKLSPLPVRLPAIVAGLRRHGVTIWPGVPLHFALTLDNLPAADLGSLRLCFSAGIELPEAIFTAFLERFAVPVRQLYGCSEAGAVTLNLDPDVRASAHSVGRPLGHLQVDIEDADDAGIGEVVIAGSALTSGYRGEDEVNRRVFAGGRFRTADLGRLDDAGRLVLTGRRRLFIDVAGNKVDPYEIEDVLRQFPGVRDAAVVGTQPAGALGSRLKAVVVGDGEVDAAALRRFCGARLAAFKVPEIVEQRPELPRSPIGKLLRKDLIEPGSL